MKIEVAKSKSRWFTASGIGLGIGLVAMVISLITLGSPLRLGLDFTGGTLLQLQFPKAIPDIAKVRAEVAEAGYPNSVVQQIGNDTIAVRTRPLSQPERSKLQNDLKADLGNFQLERIESVGPTLGQELLFNGLLSLALALAAILVYLAFRFQLDYAVCAAVAMFHNVIATMGVFAILGLLFGIEVDTLFVVAILTIVGFSVQDTVVVFDRVRENLKFLSRKKPFPDIVNDSVNQTWVRSVNNNIAALLVLLPLSIFGGESIRYFALALIIGFVVGTYSSIFIAAALLVWWRERKPASAAGAGAAKAER
ncbi:protein translocase subunit SecF [Gloeobacter morelensis]|uniref:Protein-export membrane protein SecF n=1 Tax=Gloeobacter morelensis MG652769 TaxID=2781736 RepID=A0ABY3PPX8_9CYAN|nr:protein translocase subunit SecF [Gloeobacter morelensis]UFP95746.1 protein translocase subunit SecF [Gloeobacter morelensis MG652769]